MAFSKYQPMPRYQHTSAQVANKVLVYSGVTHDYSEVSRKEMVSRVDVFYPHNEQWDPKQCTGAFPPPGLHLSASVVVNGHLYSYGGRDGDDEFVKSLHQLSATTYRWSELTSQSAKEECPMPKDGAAMAACGDDLALLGGFGMPHNPTQPGPSFMRADDNDGRGWTNEFHIYNVNKGVWSSPVTTGERPPPCAAFTFTSVDHRRAVMFGGSNNNGEMKDVYIIDFQTMHWTKLDKSVEGPWPEARSRHAACCLNYGQQHPQLLVVGGLTGQHRVLGDAWILDVDSGRWRKVEHSLQPRYSHSSSAINISPSLMEVIMFGGSLHFFGNTRLADTTILQFRFEGDSWKLTEVVGPKELGQSKKRLAEKMEYVSVSVDLHNIPTTPLHRYVRKATPTGRELGSGTYGSVIELVSAGEVVAGKVFKNSHMQPVLGKLHGEMILMMTIHHPNIVESRGVCFLEHPMPVLLMERLESSLHAYLLDPSHQDMKLTAKVSILRDVASGLSYLHNHKPAIIHRDLTARNVLLDSKLKAKIGDFGNARLMDLDPATTPETFTSLPGTRNYMPPEAFGDHVKYDPSLDVFSFGHLALFTVIQSHVDLLPPSYIQGEKIISRPEVTRRQESMKRAEQVLGKEHTLVELISYCLHNNTALRPHTEKIVATLQQVIKGKKRQNSCGGIEEEPKRIKLENDKEPTLLQLTLLTSPYGKKLEIIRDIAPDWRQFGIHFDFDTTGRDLDLIASKHPFDPINCCREMMEEWLKGRGRQPATWATLIDLLKNAKMNKLAQELETMVFELQGEGGSERVGEERSR